MTVTGDRENKVFRVEFDHKDREFIVDDYKGYKLFLYNMKDRSNFLHRNHPKQLNPMSYTFDTYWDDFEKKSVEGLWVNDGGTWVYMMPKLFFYTNYVKIVDEDRNEIHPDLSTLEWIAFSYVMCIDGFSGFMGDEDYTCHQMVKRLSYGEELDPVEIEKIPDSCYKKNGELKIFVDPWEYLTRFYLYDKPRGIPLGEPLHQNQRKNFMCLGGRGLAKSFITFMGDFIHEWIFSGVKKEGDYKGFNKRLLFAMGSGDSQPLNRSIKNIKAFYDDMPGKYRYPQSKTKKRRPDYMGPFYKKTQGAWETGKTIEHIVKNKQNINEISGSSLQMSVITPDKKKIGAGDRFRRMYVEEAGFLPYILDVHSVNKESMKIGDNKVGSIFYLGTGGDMETITGPKKMFESPRGYDIFGMTDYFKNPDKKIGLFLPAYLKFREYNDKQGNTRWEFALGKILKSRETNAIDMDSVSFDEDIMFNPIVPDEMLRPNRRSILPVREAQARMSDIDAYDLFDAKATVGTFRYDHKQRYGVDFIKDQHKLLRPILEYSVDRNKIDLEGAPIVYEHPPEYIPPNLYWLVYDTTQKSGDGESFHSIIIYKHFYTGTEKTDEDAIVAEWIGRKQTLDQNYEVVIQMAKYFNAKIFPEINVAGFVEWCKRNNYYGMLQKDSYDLEKEINPNYRAGYYKVGFQMNARKKTWTLQKLHDWLVEVKRTDEKTGVPLTRNIDYIFSPRILDEIINYNENGNFDHISSLLGLMLLLGQLERVEPPKLETEEDRLKALRDKYKTKRTTRKRRSTFENF